jgi:hypothetical protein
VDNREGLEADARDRVPAPAVEDVPVARRDGESCHSPPGITHRMDGTRRALSESSGVVGMGVRDQDGLWAEAVNAIRPVLTAVDHHPTAVMSHQQCRVQSMAKRPRVDVAACAEEGELHAGIPPTLPGHHEARSRVARRAM